MLRKTGRIVPAAIVLFWAIMMGLLVHREVIVPWQNPVVLATRLEKPVDFWMGIYLDKGARVGFVHSSSTPVLKDGEMGADIGIMARLEVPLFGRSTDFLLLGSAWISKHAGLTHFDFSIKSADHEMRIEGAVEDDRLKARVHTGDEVLPLSFPVKREFFLSGGLGMPSMTLPPLEPGTEVYVDAFDPTTLSMGKAKLLCVARETLTIAGEDIETCVIDTEIAGITTRAWVNADEEVVRAETPFGFILEKIEAREALMPIDVDETDNLVQRFAIKHTGEKPVRDCQRMRVRLEGVDAQYLPPGDEIQVPAPDGYDITVPKAPGTGTPLDEETRQETLSSDVFIQADHAKIVELAKTLGENAASPWEHALRINQWLFENIEKAGVMSVPSALEVLERREGDCNEHTVLHVALARAAGIPARIAIGLVWSDELNAFGYHAWPEVHAGQWIPMDPTFGQDIADATHIKLLNGSIDQWTRLIPFIGQLRIHVSEVIMVNAP